MFQDYLLLQAQNHKELALFLSLHLKMALSRALAAPERAKFAALTPRELEILRLIARGKSNREISVAIGIIPGTTTILGAPLLLMGLQLAIRQDQLWLPRWALRRWIERETYRTGVEKVLPRLRKVERLSKPRLSIMTSELSEVLIGVATVLLAIILVLPIWGGNLVPALIISTFGFGLMQRDGLAIILAWSAIC